MDTNEENNNFIYGAIIIKSLMLFIAFMIPSSNEKYKYDDISYDDISYL